MKIKLDKFEQDIEDNAENFVDISKKEKNRINKIIRKSKVKKSINLRLNSQDINKLKNLAAREGLPYQTLISSILHKYVTKQLIEEKYIPQILKTLKTG